MDFRSRDVLFDSTSAKILRFWKGLSGQQLHNFPKRIFLLFLILQCQNPRDFSSNGTQNHSTATMFSLYSNNDLYLRVDWSDCYDTLKYSNKRCCSARIRERERFHITQKYTVLRLREPAYSNRLNAPCCLLNVQIIK